MVETLTIFLFYATLTVNALSFLDGKANSVWKGDRPPFPTYYPGFNPSEDMEDSTTGKGTGDQRNNLYSNYAQFLAPDHSINSIKEQLKNLPFNGFKQKTLNGVNREKLKKMFTNITDYGMGKDTVNGKPEDNKTPDFSTEPTKTQKDSESIQVKNKIVSLANETTKGLESQLNLVQNIHNKLKTNEFYRLGYVVSYINRTNEEVSKVVKYIDKNKNNWDVLQLLNAYEQIRKAKDFLTQSLSLLRRLADPAPPQAHHDKSRGGLAPDHIAWSYYDDTIY